MINKVILTITGPSASGKSTMERMLCEGESVFDRIVSTTTRPPRAGEVDGKSYFFLDKGTFKDLDWGGAFLESNRYGTHYYAASKAEFERVFAADKIPVIVVDPNGLTQIIAQAESLGWLVHSVFITNAPGVRYNRLIRRFMQDVEQAGLSGVEDEIQRFADRLAMVEVHESRWQDSFHYDQVVETFDANTTKAALNTVAAKVLNLANGTGFAGGQGAQLSVVRQAQ